MYLHEETKTIYFSDCKEEAKHFENSTLEQLTGIALSQILPVTETVLNLFFRM